MVNREYDHQSTSENKSDADKSAYFRYISEPANLVEQGALLEDVSKVMVLAAA